ncbi:MAG TPA: hypothetical protein VFK13_15565 [Gemmatimonadaceae bacterium]|nr:hypothetical protein [Gemmatimonadaceae bacterium]
MPAAGDAALNPVAVRMCWVYLPVMHHRAFPLLAATMLGIALLSPARTLAQHGNPASAPADSAHRAPADTTPPHAMRMGRPAMPAAPLGIPMTRAGSGTSWLPDASPMYAHHAMAGSWELMLHGTLFLLYDNQFTDRGDDQVASVNWGMLSARRQLGAGLLTLKGMISLEPFTVTAKGYPLLLQSGESFHREPLHDRQHPHDLFMELAVQYDRALARNLAFSLYAAPVGEPALGPVAFPHRPSAADDPLAPLSHHWQDATHIVFGVATAALYTRRWKVEGSIFNGREPDEHRTNFDYSGRSLDSYSSRVTVNPDAQWSVSASYGYLATPEELHPEEPLHRISASVLHSRQLGGTRTVAGALVWGANIHPGMGASHSVLAEARVALGARSAVTVRAEVVEKSAADLGVDAAIVSPSLATTRSATVRGRDRGRDAAFALDPASEDREFTIGSLALGYVREVASVGQGSIGVGVRGSLNVIPRALRARYGTRVPGGVSVFLRVRPGRMQAMSGMSM